MINGMIVNFPFLDGYVPQRKNDNFKLKCFDNFHIFAQNIDCGYTLEAVPTSTHSLFFRAKT